MPITITPPNSPSETEAVVALVISTFDRFVAADFTAQGVETFHRLTTSAYLEGLPARNGFVLIARENSAILGMIAIRDFSHLTLFFVGGDHQGKGVGRALFEAASAELYARGVTTLSVHAAPYAVKIYRTLGFTDNGTEESELGIRYLPMKCFINK